MLAVELEVAGGRGAGKRRKRRQPCHHPPPGTQLSCSAGARGVAAWRVERTVDGVEEAPVLGSRVLEQRRVDERAAPDAAFKDVVLPAGEPTKSSTS